MKSRDMHAPHPRMLFCICRVGDCCDWLESVHAGGAHEIREHSDIILSSLLMMTRLDLLGRSCCLMRIAHRSSCVHQKSLLCQTAHRPHTSCCLVTRNPVSSPVHNRFSNSTFLFLMTHDSGERQTKDSQFPTLTRRSRITTQTSQRW